MLELKVVRKQLVLDLDKNEAPTGWRWRVDRFVRFDDGRETVVADEIPATPEEVQAHIGTAVLKQATDIEADRMARDAVVAERDAMKAERDDARSRLAEIARIDAARDEAVKPLRLSAETRQ